MSLGIAPNSKYVKRGVSWVPLPCVRPVCQQIGSAVVECFVVFSPLVALSAQGVQSTPRSLSNGPFMGFEAVAHTAQRDDPGG